MQFFPYLSVLLLNADIFHFLLGVFLIETKTKLKPLLWAEAGVKLQDTEEGKDIFCEVLYDPGPATQADVIFIHGLKGSLYK